jgi:hypothetical protein
MLDVVTRHRLDLRERRVAPAFWWRRQHRQLLDTRSVCFQWRRHLCERGLDPWR